MLLVVVFWAAFIPANPSNALISECNDFREMMWTFHIALQWILPCFAVLSAYCAKDQFFCPMNIFPFLFPIYLSINLLNSLGRSLWTQCVIGEGCFYRVQVTLWSAVSAAPRRLMPVLCPRASVIIFMTLIKCAVNIKALKWWRWNHFELRTGSLSLFFCLPLNIFLLKCIWNTPFFHWGVILKIWRHTCPLTIMKRFKEGIML